MKLTTTLNKIRACNPCASGWRTLIKSLGDDFDHETEINLLTILDSNGVADMLWTLRATLQDSKRTASHLAIEFAEQALPIFEQRRPDDPRPRKAIKAARDYLAGTTSLEGLRKARAAAYAAYDAAAAAYAAAYAADAGYAYAAAAYDAAAAAYAAAYAADAAYAAADAADAAYAAYVAAAYAAYAADAAYTSSGERGREKQAEIICSILGH